MPIISGVSEAASDLHDADSSSGSEASSEWAHVLQTSHDRNADDVMELEQLSPQHPPAPQHPVAVEPATGHADSRRTSSSSSSSSRPSVREEDVPTSREDRLEYYGELYPGKEIYNSHRYYRGTTDVNLAKARERGFLPQDTRPEMVEALNDEAEAGRDWAIRGRGTYNKHVYLTKELRPSDHSVDVGSAGEYALFAAKSAQARGEQAEPVVARLWIPDHIQVEADPDAPRGNASRLPEYQALDGKYALPDHADGPVVSAPSEEFRQELIHRSTQEMRKFQRSNPDATFIPEHIPLSPEEPAELFHRHQTPPINDLTPE